MHLSVFANPSIRLDNGQHLQWKGILSADKEGRSWLVAHPSQQNLVKICLLERDFKTATLYNVDLLEETKKEFFNLSIDAVKEIICDETNLFALVGHGIRQTSQDSGDSGFLVIATLTDRTFSSIIYTIMTFGTDVVQHLKGDIILKNSTSAYIEQPGKNKLLYISFRNSNKLFALQTDKIRYKFNQGKRQEGLLFQGQFKSNILSITLGATDNGTDRLYMSNADNSLTYFKLAEDGSLGVPETLQLSTEPINLIFRFCARNPFLLISSNPGFIAVSPEMEPFIAFGNKRIRSWAMLGDKVGVIDVTNEIFIFQLIFKTAYEKDIELAPTIVTMPWSNPASGICPEALIPREHTSQIDSPSKNSFIQGLMRFSRK